VRRVLYMLLVVLAARAGRADVVRLKNGNTIEGKIVEETDREIRLTTSGDGVMLVLRSQVASITRSEAPFEAYARRAAKLSDEDAAGHYALARYCLEHKLEEQAIVELRRALAAQPDHLAAKTTLRPLLDRRALRLFERGAAFQTKGSHEEAEKPFIEILDKYPESAYAARAHHRLAMGYAARRQFDRALSRWQRALRQDPTLAEAAEGAAQAAVELGDWGRAEAFLRQATKGAPARAGVLVKRADTLAELSRLTKAPEKQRGTPKHLAREGALLFRLGLERRGVAKLAAAYDAGSREPELLETLADHYERDGRVHYALDMCRLLAMARPGDDGLVRRRMRLERLLYVGKALATRDRKQRERYLYEVEKSHAPFQYIEQVLRECTVREPQEAGLVEGAFRVDETLVAATYHCHVPKDYDPRRPWPLLIALHRDGDNGGEHFYNVESIAKDLQCLVLLPTAPRKSRGWRHTDVNVVHSLLRQAKKRYNVDTSRVWLSGTGSGAMLAWAVAVRHPDRFAALVVRNGRVDEVSRYYLPAAMNLPVYQAVAEQGPPEIVGAVRQVHGTLSKLGYDTICEEVPGQRRHPALPELNEKIALWLADQVRDPYAPRLRLLSFEHSNATAYWVRIERFERSVFDPDKRINIKAPFGAEYSEEQVRMIYLNEMGKSLGSVKGTISTGNRIFLETRHVRELTVLLDDSMVDLGKPVRVYVNTKLRFSGAVDRSLVHLFDSARLHSDPRMCYAASVTLKLR